MKACNFAIGIVIGLSMIVSGCGESNPEPSPDELFVLESQLTFSGHASQRQLNITSHNISWEITGLNDWLEATPMRSASSEIVTVRAQANNTGNARRDTIYVTSLSAVHPTAYMITVYQGTDTTKTDITKTFE